MPGDGARLLDGYRTIDRILVAKGHHPTSPKWMACLSDFWLSGATRLVVRAGRRSGKSTTMARVALATAKYGVQRRSPGVRLHIPLISTRMDEARERIYNLEAIARDAGEPFTRTRDALELTALGIVVSPFPCSMRTAVGMDSIMIVEDEVALWLNEEDGRNPAPEVDAAIVPSLAGQPHGRVYSISTALGLDDFHAQLVDRGDTADQRVFVGPTWDWNPTISEADTHRLLPEPRQWSRAFASIPAVGALAIWTPEMVDACFVPRPYEMEPIGAPLVLTDPSALQNDRWTACVAVWTQRKVTGDDRIEWEPSIGLDGVQRRGAGNIPALRPKRDEDGNVIMRDITPGLPVLCICQVGAWEPGALVTHDAIASSLVHVARHWGAAGIFSDQYGSFPLIGAVNARGMACDTVNHTGPSKAEGVDYITSLMREGRLFIRSSPENTWAATMRREMLNFEERVGRGTVKYEGRGHDDFVSLLLLCHRADEKGLLRGGGHGPSHGFSDGEDFGNYY